MELRKVLIISPYFPPTNAADMQRIRMSLPYFRDLGWTAEIVSVDPKYSDLPIDPLLGYSVPENTIIHQVSAFSKKWTARFGLGSISLRSMWFYRKKVNALLKKEEYHLIYFSTTQFPICILGAYWKKRFGVPYVIDMQDPWHSEYYNNKPKAQRPRKYWFSYRLNKRLEPIAMKEVSGLISVSQSYIDDLKYRYPWIKNIPEAIITFSAFQKDMAIAKNHAFQLKISVKPEEGKIKIIYVGRGGSDMLFSVQLLFFALLKGLAIEPELFSRLHIFFIGTSYAAAGEGTKTIQPLAEQLGLGDYVTEVPDRIGFYEAIITLQNADILFIPGSDDPKYTASKLFPYLQSQKPILAIFHKNSSAGNILRTCSPGAHVLTFPAEKDELIDQIYNHLLKWSSYGLMPLTINSDEFNKYSASSMADKQTQLFNLVIAAAKG